MASQAHRDMTTAIAFAEQYASQLLSYYKQYKPGVKRVIPLLENVNSSADEQLQFFRRDLTAKDVLVHIANKVDRFNATTKNIGGKKETVGFIIGLVSERICQLIEHNSKSGHIERLEAVLKPLEELYAYFEKVDRSCIADEEATETFKTWETA